MDTEDVRLGDRWEKKIQAALQGCTVLIVVIGPNWLRLADQHGRRRIDREDDWVRSEIAHAIQRQTRIVPLLLSHTPLPEEAALPDKVRRLVTFQACELRDEHWEADLTFLLNGLEQFGFTRITPPPMHFPTPHVSVAELSPEEISAALASLPGWELVTSDLPGSEPHTQTEIRKAFEFKSFEDAMQFMQRVASHVSRVQHHPRWENVWRTVVISLSTWDIGHKPSRLDIDLAGEIERIYRGYTEESRGGR
jgi:pterin-4a-carbinolamine dehydratase